MACHTEKPKRFPQASSTLSLRIIQSPLQPSSWQCQLQHPSYQAFVSFPTSPLNIIVQRSFKTGNSRHITFKNLYQNPVQFLYWHFYPPFYAQSGYRTTSIKFALSFSLPLCKISGSLFDFWHYYAYITHILHTSRSVSAYSVYTTRISHSFEKFLSFYYSTHNIKSQ